MIFLRYTGKDPSWIIVVMTSIPDSDYVVHIILKAFNFVSPFMIHHGSFHNVISLIYISFIAALVFSKILKIDYLTAVMCSMMGILLHFIEDFIVYPPAYMYLYPFKMTEYGMNLIPETRDLGIAGSEVLLVGMLLLCISIGIRKYFEKGWSVMKYVNDWMHIGKMVKYQVELLLIR